MMINDEITMIAILVTVVTVVVRVCHSFLPASNVRRHEYASYARHSAAAAPTTRRLWRSSFHLCTVATSAALSMRPWTTGKGISRSGTVSRTAVGVFDRTGSNNSSRTSHRRPCTKYVPCTVMCAVFHSDDAHPPTQATSTGGANNARACVFIHACQEQSCLRTTVRANVRACAFTLHAAWNQPTNRPT